MGLVLLLRPGVAGGFGEAGSLYGMDLDVVYRYIYIISIDYRLI